MHLFGNGTQLPNDFTGIVRLFPLPNLVLFPNVVQALHIFESRYCEMLAEAMAEDKLITMALLEPGWEKNYQHRPTLSNVVCIGKVVSHNETPDGTFNILLVGLKRARIVREVLSDANFRKAKVEIIEDIDPAPEIEEALREELMETVNICVAEGSSTNLLDIESATAQIPLGALVDMISYGFPFSAEIKQRLLEEQRVDLRCKLLLQELKDHRADNEIESLSSSKQPRRDFPPNFSEN